VLIGEHSLIEDIHLVEKATDCNPREVDDLTVLVGIAGESSVTRFERIDLRFRSWCPWFVLIAIHAENKSDSGDRKDRT